jgi:hypothetical protein
VNCQTLTDVQPLAVAVTRTFHCSFLVVPNFHVLSRIFHLPDVKRTKHAAARKQTNKQTNKHLQTAACKIYEPKTITDRAEMVADRCWMGKDGGGTGVQGYRCTQV